MLILEAVWKRLFIDLGGLRGSLLRSLGVHFRVWTDAGKCLEFQWIMGFPLGPPRILATRPGSGVTRFGGLKQLTTDHQPADSGQQTS